MKPTTTKNAANQKENKCSHTNSTQKNEMGALEKANLDPLKVILQLFTWNVIQGGRVNSAFDVRNSLLGSKTAKIGLFKVKPF